ncbi:MAG: WG repeat-containing protein [Chloroflexia bacterium]|nr:WG repeat-containing protein [Chloroflexia bacterium]
MAKAKMHIPAKLLGLIESKNVYVLIDKKGGVVYNTKSKYCSNVSNGQVVIKKGKKYRLIDTKGKKILPGSYNEIAQNINEGLYVVKNKKKEYAVYTDKAEFIVPYGKYQTFSRFSEGLCFVAGKENAGYIDVSGKMKIPLECEDAQEFSEGLAAVKLQKGWAYIDKAGDVVIEGNFTHAWSFEYGIAKVRDVDYHVYFIDKKGQRVSPDLAGSFNENYKIITNDGFKGIENYNGDIIVFPAAKEISLFKKDFAPVGIQKQYGLYSSEGKEIAPAKYMIIRLNKTNNIEMINLEEVKFLN